MTLLHVLATLSSRMQFGMAVASVDHQLRPQAAEEVALVGNVANALNVPFFPLKVEVPRHASLQAAARKARYAALLALAQAQGLHHVAVGHTRDDQAETVLERLTRGAGVEGLGGIVPLRQDGVIRPLIDARRVHVMEYVRRYEIPFVDDPSNQDLGFKRARMRHTILPLLAQEDSALYDHLSQLADDARSITQWMRHEADALLTASQRSAMELDTEILTQAAEPLRRMALRVWLERIAGQRLTRAQLQAADGAAVAGGEVWLKDGWSLHKTSTVLKAMRSDTVLPRSKTPTPPL